MPQHLAAPRGHPGRQGLGSPRGVVLKNLRTFADRLHRLTGGNFFIDIVYNPGRRSRRVDIGEVFVAMPRLQTFGRGGKISYAQFAYGDLSDNESEMGGVHAQGASANRAFLGLLRVMAGKAILITIGRKTRTVRVPRDIAQ